MTITVQRLLADCNMDLVLIIGNGKSYLYGRSMIDKDWLSKPLEPMGRKVGTDLELKSDGGFLVGKVF